jgi:hypothetical protein
MGLLKWIRKRKENQEFDNLLEYLSIFISIIIHVKQKDKKRFEKDAMWFEDCYLEETKQDKIEKGKFITEAFNMGFFKSLHDFPKTKKPIIKLNDKVIIVNCGKAVSLKKFSEEKKKTINLLDELEKRAKKEGIEIWQEIKYKFEQSDKNHITEEQVKKIKNIKEFEELPIFFYGDED